MTSTIVERCHGCAPTSQPSTGPATITATTIRVSSSAGGRRAAGPRRARRTGSPTAGQRGGAELGREVHPEAQPGAGVRPRGAPGWRAPRRATAPGRAGARRPGLSWSTTQQRDAPARRRARRRAGRPRVQPRWPSAQVIGIGGDDRAELAEGAGELGDERDPPRREPGAHQPQHADERHRVAHPDEHPGQQRQRVAVGEREAGLRERQQHGADEQHAARAEPVDQQPDRDLHAGVDQQLQHRERRQLGGARCRTGRWRPGRRRRARSGGRPRAGRRAARPPRRPCARR